jgi:hypothetical protein
VTDVGPNPLRIRVALLWLWQAPQAALGLVGAWGGRLVARDEATLTFEGGWLPRALRAQAVSLGPIILTCPGTTEATMAHERAHCRQSLRLGPLYLPATLLGYGIGIVRALREGGGWDWTKAHDASPLEIEADLGSGHPENIDRNWAAAKFVPRSAGFSPHSDRAASAAPPGDPVRPKRPHH